MIALFNGKKQLLGPFNHLNIEGVYTSNYLLNADV